MTLFQKIGLYPPIGTTNSSGLHTVSFFFERGYTLYDIKTTDKYFRVCTPPFPRQQAENLSQPYACFSVNPTEPQCVDVPAVS